MCEQSYDNKKIFVDTNNSSILFQFFRGDLIEIVRIVAGIRFMLMTCMPNSKITEAAKASSVRFTKKR